MVTPRDRRLAAAATLVLAAALSASAHANMLTNSSFETGPDVPLGEMQLAVGATAIDGWIVTRAPIDLITDVYWEAAQGTRSLGLNPTSTPGGIAQTFPTHAGVSYKVSFKMSGEPFSTPAVKQMRVSAAGQQADFSFDTSTNWHWSMEWAAHTWSFTAIASSTTIEFYSLTNAQASPAIDDIDVGLLTTDVPSRADQLSLAIASPNPALGAVTFAYSLPSPGPVTLWVTDALGRRVATLADGESPAGLRFARWGGAGAAPGVYVVTLRADGRALARRFALLR
jgi:choice-of-anchor C domain-containing protein